LSRGEVRVLSAGRGRHLPALAYHYGAGSSRAHINPEEVHLRLLILFGLARLHARTIPVNLV
jgi:hypothetical protein